MSGDMAALSETIQKLALLTDVLERRAAAAIESQQRSEQALKQTTADLRGDVDQLMQRAAQQVMQSVRQSVESTLGQQTATYDQAVTATASRLSNAGRMFEQTALAMSAATYRKSLTSFAVLIGAMLLVVGGGSLLLWFQWQSYGDARARTQAAQLNAQTIEAFAQVHMTSCGGRACIKLDKKSPRWGKNGDYVLIDLASKPAAKP